MGSRQPTGSYSPVLRINRRPAPADVNRASSGAAPEACTAGSGSPAGGHVASVAYAGTGSALARTLQESRSSASCPIFSGGLWISAARPSRADILPRSNSSTSPSLALGFSWPTWFGWSECPAAICRKVLAPRGGSSPAPAPKAAVKVRRFAVVTPLSPGEVHLNSLSQSPKPRHRTGRVRRGLQFSFAPSLSY